MIYRREPMSSPIEHATSRSEQDGLGSDPSATRWDRVLLRSARLRLEIWCWAGILVGALLILEHLNAPTTFFFDEWNFVLGSRGFNIDGLLQPHNGHLSTLPVLLYRGMVRFIGLGQYLPYRVVGLLLHGLVATLVYVRVRARLGAIIGICAGTIVLMLGVGWQNILWPFQVGFMGSLASGIAAWLLIERTHTRARDLLASACVTAALLSSGLGIAVVIGTAARFAAGREFRRSLRVLSPPVSAYGLWYLLYGQSQGSMDNLRQMPRFVVDALSASAGGIFGRDLLWGRVFAGALIAICLSLARRKALPKSVVAPAVCGFANWILIAYSRAGTEDPGASRYVYVGSILLILVIVDVVQFPAKTRLRLVALVAALLAIFGNWSVLNAGASALREDSDITRSELRALEWASHVVDPSYQPDKDLMPQISALAYLDAVRDHGSPAADDEEVRNSTAFTRREVDRVSIEALRPPVEIVPRPTQGPVSLLLAGQSFDIAMGECADIVLSSGDVEGATVRVPSGRSLTVSGTHGDVEVGLRRFADQFPDESFTTVVEGTAASIRIPVDNAPIQTWEFLLTSDASMLACG